MQFHASQQRADNYFGLFMSAVRGQQLNKTVCFCFFSSQEKSDYSDAGPDGQDGSSPSSSKTKDSTPGYEEKVVGTHYIELVSYCCAGLLTVI